MNIEEIKKMEPLFGSWRITGMIGEGTNSKIYRMQCLSGETVSNAVLKAVHIESGRKISPDILSSVGYTSASDYDDACYSVCKREIEAVMSLNSHTNVVKILNYNIVEEESGGFTLLLLCEQLKPLSDGISADSITSETVIRLARDVCSALDAYASVGYCHGEIKPENIYVDSTGNFKLGDFGFCHIIKSVSQRGTAGYMAPEVYAGERPSYCSDIYSLGLLMYKFLNHNRIPFLPPFPNPISFADRELAFDKRISGEALPPPDNASPALSAVILKACSYSSAQRYQGPTQFVSALSSIEATAENNAPDEFETRYFVPVSDMAQNTAAAHRPVKPDDFTAMTRAAQTGNYYEDEAADDDDNVEDEEIDFLGKLSAGETNEEQDEDEQHQKKKINGVVLAVIIILSVVLLATAVIFAKTQLFSEQEETTTEELTTIEKVTVGAFVNSFYDTVVGDAEYSENFTFEVQYQQSDAKKGIILEQSVQSGTQVDKGTVILLTVSSGAAKIVLPDVTDKEYTEAYELLKTTGFSVTSKTVENDGEHNEGTIAQASLTSGVEYEKGTTVVLSVWGERPTQITTTEETTTEPTTEETTTEVTTTEETTTEPTTTETTTDAEPDPTEFTTDELFDDEDRQYYEIVDPKVSYSGGSGVLETVTVRISEDIGADTIPVKKAIIRSFLGNKMVQTLYTGISCEQSDDGQYLVCTLEIEAEDFEFDPANYKYAVTFPEGALASQTGTNYGFTVTIK